MTVAIIGAGYAGLVAAHRLAARGERVTVFEARGRVGGRVWTTPIADVGTVERGAEYVEHDHTVLRGLVEEFGLHLHDKGMAYGDREPRGGLGVDRETLWNGVSVLGEHLRGRGAAAPPTTIGAFIAGLPIAPGAREAIAARIQVSFAAPVDTIDVRGLGKTGGSFDTIESQSIAAGNDAVPRAIATLLGGNLRLSAPVTRIVWDEAGATVTAAGVETAFDHVIITVPVTVLAEIVFEPALPAWKHEALGQVAYGHAAKLFVPLAEMAPTGAWLSVPEWFWSWTAKGPDGRVQAVAHCFAGSLPALAVLDVDNGPTGWLDALERLRPELTVRRGDAVLQTWHDDPWARAAYSIFAAGQTDADRAALAAPVGPLHFAGEHTAGMWSATMEGAARSGERAAGEIPG
jgi:monoamine oxidase